MKYTTVSAYVLSKLIEKCPGYFLFKNDIEWLRHIDSFHNKSYVNNDSAIEATRKAIPTGKEDYKKKLEKFPSLIDPWELLVDAGISE